jgi:hypothetical protein
MVTPLNRCKPKVQTLSYNAHFSLFFWGVEAQGNEMGLLDAFSSVNGDKMYIAHISWTGGGGYFVVVAGTNEMGNLIILDPLTAFKWPISALIRPRPMAENGVRAVQRPYNRGNIKLHDLMPKAARPVRSV